MVASGTRLKDRMVKVQTTLVASPRFEPRPPMVRTADYTHLGVRKSPISAAKSRATESELARIWCASVTLESECCRSALARCGDFGAWSTAFVAPALLNRCGLTGTPRVILTVSVTARATEPYFNGRPRRLIQKPVMTFFGEAVSVCISDLAPRYEQRRSLRLLREPGAT